MKTKEATKPDTTGQVMPVVHTPGPWAFMEGDRGRMAASLVFKENDKDFHIGHVICEPRNEEQRATDLANARLIAAAPELLAALQTAAETIRAWHGEDLWDNYQHSPEMKEINAAIAKATGLVV